MPAVTCLTPPPAFEYGCGPEEIRMRTAVKWAVPVLALCLVASLGAGRKGPGERANAEKPQKPLPEGVQAVVKEHFPNGTILSYEEDHDDGRFLFFVDVSEGGKTST